MELPVQSRVCCDRSVWFHKQTSLSRGVISGWSQQTSASTTRSTKMYKTFIINMISYCIAVLTHTRAHTHTHTHTHTQAHRRTVMGRGGGRKQTESEITSCGIVCLTCAVLWDMLCWFYHNIPITNNN